MEWHREVLGPWNREWLMRIFHGLVVSLFPFVSGAVLNVIMPPTCNLAQRKWIIPKKNLQRSGMYTATAVESMWDSWS